MHVYNNIMIHAQNTPYGSQLNHECMPWVGETVEVVVWLRVVGETEVACPYACQV